MAYFAWRNAASSSGDIVGPGSSTDNAVARFDGATGKLLQNSVVLIGDTGAVSGVTTLNTSGLATLASLTVTGATTLATSLTGLLKAASGVVSAATLVNADVSASAAIDFAKLAALSSGNILVGSVGNVATSVAVTGDVTISNAGVTAIGALKVTNAMLAGSIAYSKLSLTGAILNADLAGSIAYSKLSLSNSILNADINSAAAIAYSKLNLSGSIVNADVNASAAIVYSKLSLSGSIVNADVSASAAIAGSKVAPSFGAQAVSTTSTLDVTGAVTFANQLTITGSAASTAIVTVAGSAAQNPLVGTTQRGYRSAFTATTAATAGVSGYMSTVTTAASAFTCGVRAQYESNSPAKGAGSTITRDIGFYLSLLPTDGANNAAIADNASFTGNYFINSTSTNASLLSGVLTVGATGSAQQANIIGILNNQAGTGFGLLVGADQNAYTVTTSTAKRSRISALHYDSSQAYCMLFGSGDTSTNLVSMGGGTSVTYAATSLTFYTAANNTTATGTLRLTIDSTGLATFTGNVATKNTTLTRTDVASTATINALSSATNFVYLTGSTATTINGIDSTGVVDGQIIYIFNKTGANCTFANESASATAANRIDTLAAADLVTNGDGMCGFMYSTTTSRWLCFVFRG